MAKLKLENILRIKCELCGEKTPHLYAGKVDAEKIYYLYKCLYCHHKVHSAKKYQNDTRRIKK